MATRPSSSAASEAALRARTRWQRIARQNQVALTGVLVGLVLAIGLGTQRAPGWFPVTACLVVVVLAALLLRYQAVLVVGIVAAGMTWLLWWGGSTDVTQGDLLAVTLAAAASAWFALGRQGPPLRGATGGLMIVDLRDRLAAHGRIPALPDGWRVESVVRSAHADAFSGDFVVSSTHRDGPELEIVVVDVSGKGQEAGVRSLQLSGAFGGLLGAMPREQFLPAANDYLLDQVWDEGFASAVHMSLDQGTGEYWVASAGHPPPVHLHAGSGAIEVLDTIGSPALGVVDALACRGVTGRIEPGDILMLYTDGLVDAPGLDLEQATDRLLGVAEAVLSTRRGGADAVLDALRSDEGDDRALVLVRRE
ncbi:PP2C family protein-serine/threonine phosphatase [Cellulomonas soli]|uniref:Membrane protein n=1 Tax=Cellulomonas soli TaxID=931535 RepID=A0A512PB25_9CELL|nr:PP2C family protein-serine/threonine phosphatase [Cellulomonas soli]NYI57309.1 hypothetical protein [Cellulomonas soli]GEP68411.1 membrane protein [Cellulomonas soli]